MQPTGGYDEGKPTSWTERFRTGHGVAVNLHVVGFDADEQARIITLVKEAMQKIRDEHSLN